ncbi:MAG: hypothetical protein ABG776_03025 [Cyanobacteria bacterium J06555_13]
MVAANLTITKDDIRLAPGADVVLRNQSWADYESLLEWRRDRATPHRMKFIFSCHFLFLQLSPILAIHMQRLSELTPV